MTAVHL